MMLGMARKDILTFWVGMSSGKPQRLDLLNGLV